MDTIDIIDSNFKYERIVHPLRLKKLSSIMNENNTLGIYNRISAPSITKPYNIEYTSKSNIGGAFLKHFSANENQLKCIFTRIDINKFILEIPKDEGVHIGYTWRRTITGDLVSDGAINSISVDKKMFLGISTWPESKLLNMEIINYEWSNLSISKMLQMKENHSNMYRILLECEYNKELEWIILP